MSDTVKYLLPETEMPTHWYNIAADLPQRPTPPLHPGTGQPLGPDDLEPLFPMSVIEQEMSVEREVEIPRPVRDIYRQWRPSPLYRARRLEKRWAHPLVFTTNTKVSALQAATNQIPRSLKLSTPSKLA